MSSVEGSKSDTTSQNSEETTSPADTGNSLKNEQSTHQDGLKNKSSDPDKSTEPSRDPTKNGDLNHEGSTEHSSSESRNKSEQTFSPSSTANNPPTNIGSLQLDEAVNKKESPNSLEVFPPSTSSNSENFMDQEPPSLSKSPQNIEKAQLSAEPEQINKEIGQWENLSSKIKTWTGNKTTDQLLPSLLLVVSLITLFILLQIYGSVLTAIGKIPLAPRLFEFAGILWLFSFSITNLARSKDRQEVLSQLQKRWLSFRGGTEADE